MDWTSNGMNQDPQLVQPNQTPVPVQGQSQPPVQGQAPAPTPLPTAPKKDFRNKKKLILIAGGAMLGAVVIGAGIWILTVAKSDKKTPDTSNQSQTDKSKTPGSLAYHLANPASSTGTVVAGGDIWLTNTDGSDKKQLTKDGNLNRMYSWSPDNSYILVNVFSSASKLPKFAVVNTKDGSIKELESVKTTDLDGSFVWLSDNEFGYISENTYYKTSVNDRTTVVVSKVSNLPNNKGIKYVISPNGKKIAYYQTGDGALPNLYVVDTADIENPKKVSDKLNIAGPPVVWAAESLYYLEDKSIVRYRPIGQREIRETILTHTGDKMLNLAVAPDQASLIYTLAFPNSKPNSPSGHAYEIVKMYAYYMNSQQSKDIATLPPGDYIAKLQYSRDSSLAAYNLTYSAESGYKAPMKAVTISDLTQKDICTSQCQTPTWQQ